MLELTTYKPAEIGAYLGTFGKEATERKLKRYGIQYYTDGTRANLTYTITAIPDPFKVFCVFDLGIDPRVDFTKFRDFLFYLLGDEDFSWRPKEMMEEYLREVGSPLSRKTISKYINRLEKLNLIYTQGDVVYYKVYKYYGVQKHEIITKEEYSAAWAVYWEKRRNNESWAVAYCSMYSKLGGVPRKQCRA